MFSVDYWKFYGMDHKRIFADEENNNLNSNITIQQNSLNYLFSDLRQLMTSEKVFKDWDAYLKDSHCKLGYKRYMKVFYEFQNYILSLDIKKPTIENLREFILKKSINKTFLRKFFNFTLCNALYYFDINARSRDALCCGIAAYCR